VFDIEVKGGPNSGFDPPVSMKLLGRDKNDECIGFNEGTSEDSWKCLGDTNKDHSRKGFEVNPLRANQRN